MKSDSRIQAKGHLARLLAVATLVLALALGGCGGGGTTLAGGGTSGTGITQGSVTGFGSVIVNGVEFDTTGARVLVEGQSAPNGQDDLAVGMVVTVRGSWDGAGNGTATEVAYDDDLRGPVESVDVTGGSFTVLGRTVRVDGSTVFDAEDGSVVFNDLADLGGIADAAVEVSGFFNGAGELVASRVELEDGPGEVEIKGRVQDLNDSGGSGSFRIGTLTVTYDTGTEGDVGQLANGLFFEVRGTYSGGDLQATRIKREDDGLGGDEGEDASLEGLVAEKTSATEFAVSGQRVRVTANTAYEDGQGQAELLEGTKIEVEGTLVNGVLVAREVEFRESGEIRLEDRVLNNPSNSTFTTYLGIEVRVTDNTLFKDDRDDDTYFDASDLVENDFVEVRGSWDPDAEQVVATRVEREEPEDGCTLRGAVNAVDSISVQILTVTVVPNDPDDLSGVAVTDEIEASTGENDDCAVGAMSNAEF